MTPTSFQLRAAVVLTCALVASAASFSADRSDLALYRISVLKAVGHGINSSALGISPNGQYVVGRQLTDRFDVRPDGLGYFYDSMRPMWWSEALGAIALANFRDELKRKYSQAFSVNNDGIVVGTSSTTYEGLHPLPIRWLNGEPAPFPLPLGYITGRANAVNSSGTAIGSVGWQYTFRPAVFTMSGSTTITSLSVTGRSMFKATGISDDGLVVGESRSDDDLFPSSASLIYNSTTGEMIDIGALKGDYTSRAYGISSNSKYVVGLSASKKGLERPYIWSEESGMVYMPLPAGMTDGYATAVNDLGWAVGMAWSSEVRPQPFLSMDGRSYFFSSLLPPSSAWEFLSSPTGISNDGKIVGAAKHNGVVTAYVMLPSDLKKVSTPASRQARRIKVSDSHRSALAH